MSSTRAWLSKDVAIAQRQQLFSRQKQRTYSEPNGSERLHRKSRQTQVRIHAPVHEQQRVMCFEDIPHDALCVVVSFVALNDLPTIASASQHIRAIVYDESCRNMSFTAAVSSLPLLVFSPLSRHISSLYINEDDVLDSMYLQATKKFIHLKELKTSIQADSLYESFLQAGQGAGATASVARMFPIDLTALTLRIGTMTHPVATQQLIINVISCLTQLRTIKIRCTPSSDNIEFDLAPLQRLPYLKELTLEGWTLSPVSALALGALEHVKMLNVDDGKQWTSEELLRALCDPASCKLKHLTSLRLDQCILDASHVQVLVHLPALSDIFSWHFCYKALPLLRNLVHVKSLRIAMIDGTEKDNVDANEIVSQIRHMPALRELRLDCFIITIETLEALVHATPLLNIIALNSCTLPLLNTFCKLQHLRALDIQNCPSFTLEHLISLADIASLRCLVVQYSLSLHNVGRFILTSSKFAQLECFEQLELNIVSAAEQTLTNNVEEEEQDATADNRQRVVQ
jgi:hypothetical protein